MSWLRRRAGPLIIVGSSALAGAAYRILKPLDSSETSLNPHTFTPFTLVNKQPVSSTSAIFTLRNRNGVPDPNYVREALKRSTWSVQIKQPQLQIARAYTPLPPTEDISNEDGEKSQDIRLLIRQETGGEVSTYLHRLPEQSTIELRGPNFELELPHDLIEVIFLAGGTGIAPAMQVAQALKQKTNSSMHILWANRRREECVGGISDSQKSATSAQGRSGWFKGLTSSSEPAPQTPLVKEHIVAGKGVIVNELDALKARSRAANSELSIQYCVDEERTFIQPKEITKLVSQKLEEPGSRLIIVSGPNGFIEHWAGKKIWAAGREVQGPLGGQLGRMNLGDWKVVKL